MKPATIPDQYTFGVNGVANNVIGDRYPTGEWYFYAKVDDDLKHLPWIRDLLKQMSGPDSEWAGKHPEEIGDILDWPILSEPKNRNMP